MKDNPESDALNLSATGLPDDHCSEILHWIKKFKNLRTLELSSNGLRDCGHDIAKYLKENKTVLAQKFQNVICSLVCDLVGTKVDVCHTMVMFERFSDMLQPIVFHLVTIEIERL